MVLYTGYFLLSSLSVILIYLLNLFLNSAWLFHGTSIPPPDFNCPSAASRGCLVTSAPTKSTISFFSAGAATLDNPSGICPIVSFTSPTTLLLC